MAILRHVNRTEIKFRIDSVYTSNQLNCWIYNRSICPAFEGFLKLNHAVQLVNTLATSWPSKVEKWTEVEGEQNDRIPT